MAEINIVELSYLLQLHKDWKTSSMLSGIDEEILCREKECVQKGTRSILVYLREPPVMSNVFLVLDMLQRVQNEHDSFLDGISVKFHAAPGFAGIADAWRSMPTMDFSILCSYCTEQSRSIRRLIRSGKAMSPVLFEQVRALNHIYVQYPQSIRGDYSAILDFYQQAVVDMRRVQSVLLDQGDQICNLEPCIQELLTKKRAYREKNKFAHSGSRLA